MKLQLPQPVLLSDHLKPPYSLPGSLPARISATILLFWCWLFCAHQASGQCTPASVNWDWQYKVNAFTSGARFGLGVNAMAMTWAAEVTPAAPPANSAFTGYGTGGYGEGSLAQFTVRNGAITLTFDAEVQNVKLAVYDLDNEQAVTVTARNGAASPINVVLEPTNAKSLVTVSGSNTASATASGPGRNLGNTVTTSGVNIEVVGPVKTITLTFSKAATGADDVWLSDIAACVTGDYASAYPAVATPEAGQPGYVVAAEGNNVYAINTGNAQAIRLFTDAGLSAINSVAYDPYNQVVYYANGAGATTNKSIYKYDVKTCTRTTFIADVTASPFNMSLNSQGVGGGGAAFYNGSLFFGVDAGVSVTEDNAIWRIDIDAAGQATGAARVFSVKANEGNTSLYNWGDFVLHDGTLYNFNSATSPAANTQVVHYNLNAQVPTAGYTLANTGQAALGYDGTVYTVTNGLAVYTKTGTLGTAMAFGGDWPAGVTALDGGGAFRFPADFGDAPAGYGRPFHRFTPCASATGALLQLGATIDYEMAPAAGGLATGDNGGNYAGSGTTNDEDGVAAFPALTLTSAGTAAAYALTVAVRNTTGVARVLWGWIDFDGDGKFSVGEHASATVAHNATSATLTWAARAAGTTRAGLTYARLRLTTTALADNAASAAEDERALAPANDGEVEDYALSISLSLSGAVLRDANGLMDNLVNGSALGTAGGTALYAYLVNGTTIVDKVLVGSNGQYTLAGANANTTYTVLVSTASRAIGAAAPAAALPAGWVQVGETAGTTPDASPDGQLTLTTTTASLGGLNFGIEQLPVSKAADYAIIMPPPGTLLPLTAAHDLEPLSGTDPEDGPLGANNQVIITSLAGMEGNELYYNNVLLQAGSSIGNYNPELLALKVKSPGSNGAAFDFVFVDAAGQRSAAPTTYSLTWATPLPLTLISFEVRKANRQASLQWVTALEENTQSFEVEHSLDGKNWTAIGRRPAAGNSTGKLSYSFTHAAPAQAPNLYRLKLVDLDGSFTYSAVKVLTVSEAPELRCYPNPVTDKLYIAAPAGTSLERLTLADARGSLVYEGRSLAGAYIDMQHLPAGIYVVQVFAPNAPVKSYKVVKR